MKSHLTVSLNPLRFFPKAVRVEVTRLQSLVRQRRSGHWLFALSLAALLVSPRTTPAATEAVVVPELLNYQARLQTLAGADYAEGMYPIEVRIWSAATGGTLLWGESYRVYVKGGRLNMLLGQNGTPVSSPAPKYAALREVFKISGGSSERWLGMTVKADETGKPLTSAVETQPRQQLLTAPFAYQSQYAQYASQAGTNGAFVAATGLNVSGARTTISAGLDSTGGLTVSGPPTDLRSALYVSGTASFSNTVTFVSMVTNKSGLDVSGPTTLRGGATISGDATFTGLLKMDQYQGKALVASPSLFQGPIHNNIPDGGLWFPYNPWGGFRDLAYLSYYRRSTNGTPGTLELGIGDDTDDNLVLKASGTASLNGDANVQINTPNGQLAVNASSVSGVISPAIPNFQRLTSVDAISNNTGNPVASDGFLVVFGYHGWVHFWLDFDGNGTWDYENNLYFEVAGSDTTQITWPLAKGAKYYVKLTKMPSTGTFVDVFFVPMGGRK